MKYTEDNLGEEITFDDEHGSYYQERVVQVVCSICAGSYIGPIRQAGGFLSGHMAYHDWEFKMMMSSEQGLVA